MVYDNNAYSFRWCANRKSRPINSIFCVMDCNKLQEVRPALCALKTCHWTSLSAFFLSFACFLLLPAFLVVPLAVIIYIPLLFLSIRWFRPSEQQIWTTLQMESFPSICLLSIQPIPISPWRIMEVGRERADKLLNEYLIIFSMTQWWHMQSLSALWAEINIFSEWRSTTCMYPAEGTWWMVSA